MRTDENDRELLELAAKAACIEIKAVIGDTFWTPDGIVWNPLTEDGDALRLAVRLRMDVRIGLQNHTVTVGWGAGLGCVEEIFESDDTAATRRAVTRAAAEIGKAMA